MAVIFYIVHQKVTAHVLRADGNTVCGLSVDGPNWTMVPRPELNALACQKCRERLETADKNLKLS